MGTENLRFNAIGTSWNIDLPNVDKDKAAKLLSLIIERIEIFDKSYSRFRADSLVSEIAKSANVHTLPEDAKIMISLYEKLLAITNGKMTPLIGQVLSDAGYDSSYSLKPKTEIPKAKKWHDVIKYEHPYLTTKESVLLDFGALGKGYLVDIVAEIIRSEGINSYTVNAGGDIAHQSESSTILRVGLEDPDDSEKVIGIAEILNKSICGSAGNRRKWARYHHIIDPDTGESPKHILALWVVADSTIIADAISTALFFKEPAELLKHFNFEYAIVYADHSGITSPGFPGNFFNS